MENLKSKKQILLTGAGFSKNFGGFLAKEMFDEIYNSDHLKKFPTLRDKLLATGDFEFFYAEAMLDKNLTPEEKGAVKAAVQEAYNNLDKIFQSSFISNGDLLMSWGDFLSKNFSGNGSAVGLFFTLNQDLLLERSFGNVCPGVKSFRMNGLGQADSFSSSHSVVLPQDTKRAEADILVGNLSYFKLHGSYGWKSSDGTDQMVVGSNKSELIEKEPILKLYFDVFKKAIAEGNKNILIIGYGFRDKHINDVLMDGVENHGLKIVCIGNSSIADVIKKAENEYPECVPLLRRVDKYFPYPLERILNNNAGDTSFRDRIEENIR
ncbi:MAG: hypothetical protein JWM20_867 [Patescibacteria group bacterium]|nr:hypothetical protein [Patescibacteria group bacterium]